MSGAMNLIMKRIGENVRVSDVKDLIGPLLKGGLFKRTGYIVSIQIQRVREYGALQTEYYAIVAVSPYHVGKRVVKALNRKFCFGKPINVVEYFSRCGGNDRRQSRYRAANERRMADRRRNLQVIDVTEESGWRKTKTDMGHSQAGKTVSEYIDWY